MLFLETRIQLPRDRGLFKWHTQDVTWRYAVWLFERCLVWVDSVQDRHEVVPLPAPGGGRVWEVAAVGPQGDWIVVTGFRESAVPGDGDFLAVESCHSRGGLGELRLFVSWTSVTCDGRESVSLSPKHARLWNTQIGREVARYQWRKGKDQPLSLRSMVTFHMQADPEHCPKDKVVLDTHPTREGLALVQDKEGVRSIESYRAQRPRGPNPDVWSSAVDFRFLFPRGDVAWSWTRLGSVVLQDATALRIPSRGPSGWSWNTEHQEELITPWEDHKGHIWYASRGELCRYAHVKVNFEYAALVDLPMGPALTLAWRGAGRMAPAQGV